MIFPLVPTVIILSLCGIIVAGSLTFLATRNIKAVGVSVLMMAAGGVLLYLYGILQLAADA